MVAACTVIAVLLSSSPLPVPRFHAAAPAISFVPPRCAAVAPVVRVAAASSEEEEGDRSHPAEARVTGAAAVLPSTPLHNGFRLQLSC